MRPTKTKPVIALDIDGTLGDCIESTAPAKGYGYCKGKKKNGYAHREAWEELNGPIPKGLVIRHKCHNRKCINVDHLMIGSCKDNTKDMFDAGRNFVQTRTITDEVIQRYLNGEPTDKLAEEIGVHRNSITRAARDRGLRKKNGKINKRTVK